MPTKLKQPASPTTPPKDTRVPAQKVLLDFLKKNNIDFAVRKQQLRYLEDKGTLIEPPVIIVYYRDQVPQAPVPPKPDSPKLDLPK
ncbi:MAG TPA: hypothetical protein ENI23_10960 [bacterium]|nr:hypothetical protein [bacterium]